MVTPLEREVDALYQLPLDHFTAARDELAKRLRADGQTGEAREVKALQKPTVAVWLVNRLVREDELDVQRLIKAGESLTEAHLKAAEAHSSERFLEARREEQRALERLARAAHQLANREGVGSSAIDRAIQTLRAASLTDEGRQLLKRARLTEELQPPGFEALTGLMNTPSRQPSERPQAQAEEPADRRRALKKARESLNQLRAEERKLRSAARVAAHAAERAETEARRARELAARAQLEAEEANTRVEVAKGELEQLHAPASNPQCS
jgi:hypothetical protein